MNEFAHKVFRGVPCLWEVLKRLPPPALLSAARVCKGWRECSKRLWKAVEELRLRVPPTAQNYNAKLSDFGLARDGPTGDKSYVSTRVMGTHGYAAPEYLATGHLTTKSDVYSFGVVLLEIISKP